MSEAVIVLLSVPPVVGANVTLIVRGLFAAGPLPKLWV
jgi:hypothetical protein